MGLMTTIFVADGKDAKGYDFSDPSTAGIERIDLGGLTNLHFEILWAILEGEEWTPGKHDLPEIGAQEESWTFEFPSRFVDRLRTLQATEISAAAGVWAATEEISATPAEVLPVIQTLVAIARTAGEKRSGLFLWVSL